MYLQELAKNYPDKFVTAHGSPHTALSHVRAELIETNTEFKLIILNWYR